MAKRKSNTPYILFPVWGILLFLILYIVAASLYPGGSDIDKMAKGFSWLHNYWCELMAREAQNGQPNSARPVAITAMFVLAISLIVFWYQVSLFFRNRKMDSHAIRYCGIGSMLVMPLLLTGMHDSVINLAGLLGCIAIILVLTNLFREKIYLLFSMGIFCLLLCVINNYVYYTNDLLLYLPVIQKISFIIFLSWFILLSLALNKNEKLSSTR